MSTVRTRLARVEQDLAAAFGKVVVVRAYAPEHAPAAGPGGAGSILERPGGGCTMRVIAPQGADPLAYLTPKQKARIGAHDTVITVVSVPMGRRFDQPPDEEDES